MPCKTICNPTRAKEGANTASARWIGNTLPRKNGQRRAKRGPGAWGSERGRRIVTQPILPMYRERRKGEHRSPRRAMGDRREEQFSASLLK